METWNVTFIIKKCYDQFSFSLYGHKKNTKQISESVLNWLMKCNLSEKKKKKKKNFKLNL